MTHQFAMRSGVDSPKSTPDDLKPDALDWHSVNRSVHGLQDTQREGTESGIPGRGTRYFFRGGTRMDDKCIFWGKFKGDSDCLPLPCHCLDVALAFHALTSLPGIRRPWNGPRTGPWTSKTASAWPSSPSSGVRARDGEHQNDEGPGRTPETRTRFARDASAILAQNRRKCCSPEWTWISHYYQAFRSPMHQQETSLNFPSFMPR